MSFVDKDIKVMYLASHVLISQDNVEVEMSIGFNRKSLPSGFSDEIIQIWEKRTQMNSTLFNASKFRLSSITGHTDIVKLKIGLTSYKDFIGTNWSPNAARLADMGISEHNDSHAFMSDALGVGAFVETCDNFVVFLRRSQHCGEAAGLWDIPGGHAEPQNVVPHGVDSLTISPQDLSPHKVIEEIYHSIMLEVQDEVNIPLSAMTHPRMIGVARNMTSAGRPSMEFFIRCNMSRDEVMARYRQGGHAEAEESTNILLLKTDHALNLRNIDRNMWDTMAPSAKGCLIMFNTFNVSKTCTVYGHLQ